MINVTAENSPPTEEHQPPSHQPDAPKVSILAGRWYFVVTILSAGFLAWVPFLHAAGRLRRRSLHIRAALYGAGAALTLILITLTPTDAQGQTISAAGEVMSAGGGLLVIAITVMACVQQVPLRREVYHGTPPPAPQPSHLAVPPGTDPAIAAALAARTRREEARQLAARDPLLARELRIGRPDLPRTYDDGGLVELNTAPAAVIAQTCDLPTAAAEAIVSARAEHTFLAVDEIFSIADLPVTLWDVIRDRGIVL